MNKKIIWIAVAVLVVILIIVFVVTGKKKSTEKVTTEFTPKPLPPPSPDPLTIVKATYICPGGNTFNHATIDVTSKLASLVKDNSVYIPSPVNMNNVFGQNNPNWCGCPNECTHTRLDVKFLIGGKTNTTYDVSFADTDSIVINR